MNDPIADNCLSARKDAGRILFIDENAAINILSGIIGYKLNSPGLRLPESFTNLPLEKTVSPVAGILPWP